MFDLHINSNQTGYRCSRWSLVPIYVKAKQRPLDGRVQRYLKGTLNYGLKFSVHAEQTELNGYSDAIGLEMLTLEDQHQAMYFSLEMVPSVGPAENNPQLLSLHLKQSTLL